MKIFIVENNQRDSSEEETFNWYLLADSAVTNTGKPFYVPDGYGDVSAKVGIAVRINRLGKSVAEKFAGRYYYEMAPVLNFRLKDLEMELKGKGLSPDPSRNFDRALFVGDFRPFDETETFTLTKNGEKVAVFEFGSLKRPVSRILEEISKLNTLKMGDLVVPDLAGDIKVSEGDLLEIFSNEGEAFAVRVK